MENENQLEQPLAEVAKPISRCRACGNLDFVPILDLGSQYISNFVSPDKDPSVSPQAPLDLVLCDAEDGGCSLLQLHHTTSPKLMYRHYWYRSIVNDTMRLALRDISESAEATANLQRDDLVLDIGCNDGTLLRSYATPGLRLVGFEPAENIVREAQPGTTHIFNAFFNADAFVDMFGSKSAQVITSIAMFYDLDDPNTFTADVRECLKDDGVWIIQMAYLPVMLENTMFDNICHEHLEYYSVSSLQTLLEDHGFEIFDVVLNDVNGGSFRTYIRKRGSLIGESDFGRARVEALRSFERYLDLENQQIYKAFAQRSLDICDQLRTFISSEANHGRKTYVYGASTKGNTLLQLAGLDHRLIMAAAERNPDKWGKRTVGTGIPIISEEQARSENPDYFLALPWHFLREFREREKTFLDNGGHFIAPLPQPRLIGAGGARPLH